MIPLRPLRQLTLAPSQAAVPEHLSAASGIVVAGRFLYVIADDELHLGVFDLAGAGDGVTVRLFPGELPDEAAARKARKPDLEALVRLPPFPGYPAGALFALPSGSRPNRQTGALLGLDDAGAPSGTPGSVDLSALYAPLRRRFPALNVEGAVVCDQQIVLLQRASGDHPENALIRLPLADVLQALSAADGLRVPELSIETGTVNLGGVDGVPLGLTDAAALPDGRLAFSAVAERVDDTYHDGPCIGAAIGILGADGLVQRLEFVQPVRKIEGIDARREGDAIQLLLVSDADDRRSPGILFSATLAESGVLQSGPVAPCGSAARVGVTADRIALDEQTRSARHAIALVAAAVLAGTTPLLDGCRRLLQLRSGANLAEDDPDFGVLRGVESETDALPVGTERRHWSPEALARLEPEIQAATEWARPIVLPACELLVRRFGQPCSGMPVGPGSAAVAGTGQVDTDHQES